MPIKGLVLILLCVVIVAFVEREQIYSWLKNLDQENEKTEEYEEDEEK